MAWVVVGWGLINSALAALAGRALVAGGALVGLLAQQDRIAVELLP